MEPISTAIFTAASTKAAADTLYDMESANPVGAIIQALLIGATGGSTAGLPGAETAVKAIQLGTSAVNAVQSDDAAVHSAIALTGSAGTIPSDGIQNASEESASLRVKNDDGTFRQEVVLDLKVTGNENTLHTDGSPATHTITADITTVDERYTHFGHLQDCCNELAQGHIPSAHTAYLALLDIVDAIDCNIMGDKLTHERIQDHIQHRKLELSDTSTEVSTPHKAETSKTKNNDSEVTTSKQQITEVNTKKITLSVDGEQIDGFTVTERINTTVTEVNKRENLSLKDDILGEKVKTEQTETTVREITVTVDRFDANSGQMVEIAKHQKHELSPTSTQKSTEWESGYISYIPLLGTGVDLTRKHQAGFTITTQDKVLAIIDVGTSVLTFGTGAAVGSLAKGAVTIGAKTTAKTAVAKIGSKATLNGAKAAAKLSTRFRSLGTEVFSTKRIATKTATVAHNPMKADFVKSMVQLKKMESEGVKIKSYLKKEFAHQGRIGELRAHNLETQFRFAKQQGLLTKNNLELMAQGKNPINKLGQRMDIDHVIPKSLAPELKADPANLAFLNQTENIAKSNNMMRHVMQHIEKMQQALPDWTPGESLQQAINDYRATAHV